MRWRFFFWEALASIRANAATTMAATVTVLIVTFLLGVFVTTAWWVYHYAVGVRNEVTVKLYLPASYTTERGPARAGGQPGEGAAVPEVLRVRVAGQGR